jgi:hypothetical protein
MKELRVILARKETREKLEWEPQVLLDLKEKREFAVCKIMFSIEIS